MRTKLVIIDPECLTREGLIAKIGKRKNSLSVVGSGATVGEAVAQTGNADVVIIGVHGSTGKTAKDVQHISRVLPAARVIAICDSATRGNIRRMKSAGATGFLTRECTFQEFEHAVKCVASDGFYVSREMFSYALLQSHGSAPHEGIDEAAILTSRERQVLQLRRDDLYAKEIANQFGISVKTVYTHYRNIRQKLGIEQGDRLV